MAGDCGATGYLHQGAVEQMLYNDSEKPISLNMHSLYWTVHVSFTFLDLLNEKAYVIVHS